mmetsp:Transcript_42859/g.67195  ORF Transcript_42859/g.67195 Transcript_42859/m.67195 type:complete len:193 (-) Transcript_42859:2500-3078(-)
MRSDLNKRAKELQKILNDENGVHTTVDLISRFMQRPWDRTAMQILPRREGDLEMQEGTMFKSWNRYKFVLKDHCLEFHRYLPTGLHDPVVMGSYVIADADVSEFKDSSGYQQHALEIKDKKGKKLVTLGASNAREQDAWIQALKDVASSWEVASGTSTSWSTVMSNKLMNADGGEIKASDRVTLDNFNEKRT